MVPFLSTAANAWSFGTVLIWLAGLACGAMLMVSLTTDWQRLPAHLRLLSRALKAQIGWVALAASSLGVLVFY